LRRLLRPFDRRRWLPTLICAIVIYAVSTIPGTALGARLFPGCDKVFHFIEYLILGVTLRYWSGESRKIFLAGGIGFSALDELYQQLVPNRIASFWDFLADSAGILVGYLFVSRLLGKETDD
jgi:VanZ family protein